MAKKHGAAALQDNALRNSDELVKSVMERFAKQQSIIDEARGAQKEILREGKEAGILKQAIRKAYKDLMMTEEQKQAKDEVEAARQEYARICAEVGLFVQVAA